MNASEQSLPQSDPGTDDTAAPPVQKPLGSLDDLLAAEFQAENAPSGEGSGDTSSGSEQQKQKPIDRFNDLAGATGLELDALYKLEIGLSEGADPVTIEQLKDSYQKRTDLNTEILEFEERRIKQESKLMQDSAELTEILQSLPANAVKPDVLQRIRDRAEKLAASERAKTLEAIPKWQDETTRTKELGDIVSHLGEYGIPPQFIEQIVSHQMLKYLRDNMIRKQRVDAALSKVRAGKPDKKVSNAPQDKAPRKTRSVGQTKNHGDRLKSVFESLE